MKEKTGLGRKNQAGALKTIAVALAAALALCALPTNAVSAAGTGAMTTGTGGIAIADLIYFGKYTKDGADYDMRWYLIGEEGLLLSEHTLGVSKYRNEAGYYATDTALESSDSILKTVMDGLYDSGMFSAREKTAIESTTLAGNTMDRLGEGGDISAYLYPLSSEMAFLGLGSMPLRTATDITDPAGAEVSWWTRTAPTYSNDANEPLGKNADYAHFIINARGGGSMIYYMENGVRPALTLDIDKVVLSSAAVGGKLSGAEGPAALTAVSSAAPTEWKLTLLESSRNFSASTAAKNGNVLRVSYSGAETGSNEYISAVVKNASGGVSYYGRLKSAADASAESGSVDIDLSGIDMTNQTLHLFSEQFNGDKAADYASALCEVSLEPPAVLIAAQPVNLDFGSVAVGASLPAAQTVTVRNTGNSAVTVALPSSAQYDVSAANGFSGGSATLAANGDTASFTVRPRAGLAASPHNEVIPISGSGGASAAVAVSYSVASPVDTGSSAAQGGGRPNPSTGVSEGGGRVNPWVLLAHAAAALTAVSLTGTALLLASDKRAKGALSRSGKM